MAEKIRTIITQDAEVDDQNSLRHFLLVSNQVEIQGIVQSSSIFHWIGVEGKETPEQVGERDAFGLDPAARFDRPWRWTGTDWMMQQAYEYEYVYPYLSKQAQGYPTPDYIRSIIKVGNIGYMGEMDAPTEGSELIREKILDDDPRTLYLQVWGGTNTIARALYDIQLAHQNDADWKQLHDKIEKKVVITACGEQDTTYREYIAEEWPNLQFVKTLQIFSYAYPWRTMPRGASFDSLTSEFMTREVLNPDVALLNNYCTWMDGKVYMGEGRSGQFGLPSNARLWEEPENAEGLVKMLPPYRKYDFISEGDSPTFFCLMDWGFRTLENFTYGGISGRYEKKDEKNSRGEPLNLWYVTKEDYTSPDGTVTNTESMWRYTADLQHDFAARAQWCVDKDYADAEHAPKLAVEEGLDFPVKAGDVITLHAKAYVPDALGSETGAKADVNWRVYREASTYEGDTASILDANGPQDEVTIQVPADAKTGDTIHVIAQAVAGGHLHLTHYAQVIITVQ